MRNLYILIHDVHNVMGVTSTIYIQAAHRLGRHVADRQRPIIRSGISLLLPDITVFSVLSRNHQISTYLLITVSTVFIVFTHA